MKGETVGRDRAERTATAWRLTPSSRRVIGHLVPIVCPPEVTELAVESAIIDHAEASIAALPGSG